MSTLIPPRPRQIAGIRRRFAIVASQFNQQYVQGLVNHATQELRNLAPNATIDLHQVPGAFEIPILVRELARQKNADAILALAVILKGKTNHAEHLSRSVTDALQRIAIEDGIPIINAVLSLTSETQARERCLEQEMNRGTEAARTAVQISSTLADLREKVHG
jgi:6,7-dimethyl-8-ribityllumazine synthase